MKHKCMCLFLALLGLLIFSCATSPTAPKTNDSTTNASSTTNLISSTTNKNIVTNFNQVVTTSNIANYYYTYSWGGWGSGDNQLNRPTPIRFDAEYNLYVADTWNYQIKVFKTNGVFIRKWGAQGTSNGAFNTSVKGLGISSDFKVYASDSQRVQVFTTNGLYITKWGSSGTGDGQFDSTTGAGALVIDSSNSIMVADNGNSRAQKFDTNGIYLSQFPITAYTMSPWGTNFLISESSTYKLKLYNYGGTLLATYANVSYTYDTAKDPSGRFFSVYNGAKKNIVVLDASGLLLFDFGVSGTNTAELNIPHSIQVDALTNVYVSDLGDDRIKVFSWSTQTFYYTNYTTNVTTNQ